MIIRRCSTRGAFEAIPDKAINLDLEKIRNKYKSIADLPILIIIKIEEYEITCYKNGKLVIRNCDTKEEANRITNEIYEAGK